MSKLHPIAERIRKPGPKRILALDGGGIRGALTLGYLEKIEDILREQHNDPDLLLCDYFDMIAGTSTGAIIGSGLAIGMQAKEIKKLYLDLGKIIFGKKSRRNKLKYFRSGAKYDHLPLEKELDKIFGNITLGDERIKTALVINAKRADTYSLWPVHNNPDGKYYDYNKHILLKDLLRATSAAPTYFEPKVINVQPPGNPPEYAAFIDGGVSHANNPSLISFMISQLEGFRFNWPLNPENLLLVSLGTGTYKKKEDYRSYLPKNILKWAGEIPNILMEDATYLNQMVLQFLTKSDTSHLLDNEVGDMKNDTLNNKSLLTYLRYNVNLDEKDLKPLNLTKPLTGKLIKSLREMDQAKNKELLAEIGEKGAASIKDEHFTQSFNLNNEKPTVLKFTKHQKPDLAFDQAIKKPIPIQCRQMSEPFVVETLEGNMRGEAGDYLMVGINGEMYPCAKDIFEKTYDKVNNS